MYMYDLYKPIFCHYFKINLTRGSIRVFSYGGGGGGGQEGTDFRKIEGEGSYLLKSFDPFVNCIAVILVNLLILLLFS